MEYKDYYKSLGVSRDATQDDIKRAYRRLARKYHPDVSKERNAEERFKEIGEAYEVLKDPEKKAAYNQLGSNWRAGQEFRPPPGWEQSFEFRSQGFGAGHGFGHGGSSPFSDFFESLFGGRAQAGRSPDPTARSPRGRGADEHTKVRISLHDAYNGAERTLKLQQPSMGPFSANSKQSRTLKVRIPAGVTQGQQIRLAGQGRGGLDGGSKSDLFLEVELQPHPLFRVDGKDIHLDLPITPWEAALGAKVKVPTLGGRVDLKIPPGSQSGGKLRLKGRGLGGSKRGDQLVILQITTPTADSPPARALYEKMAREMPFNPRSHMDV